MTFKNKPQLILASASIGRRDLLQKFGLPFEVMPSEIDEEEITDEDPYTRLANRARIKAETVFKKLISKQSKNNYLIVAADSEALLNGKTYGKSRDKHHAREIVSALMGHTHEFLTATCFVHINNGKETKRWENITKTYVTMRKLTSQELDTYTSRYDFTRFAAGYTLNETPWDLITKIEGSYTNVIGLPFEVLLPVFRKTFKM